jgi:AcrR family transcriptional regulator
MTATPWGEAERMRARRLRPGPGKRRERVREIQRERLLAGTVAAVAEKGYEASRVADILKVSGVSRNAFYEQFDSKHDCFVATLAALADFAGPSVLSVYDSTPGPWDRKLGAMLDALAAVVVDQPAMARVAWVEAYAAGPDAVRELERIDDDVEQIVRRALKESGQYADAPRDVVRASVVGIRKIVHARLSEQREHELPALMPELLTWLRTYETPTERLRRPRKVPAGLVPAAPAATDPKQRIVAAITALSAESGYAGMTISEVAQRAAVSLTTFYRHFDGKDEAFVAAIDDCRQRALEVATAAYRRADTWPHAVAAGVHALFGLMSSEPAFAGLGWVAAYEGGPLARLSHDHAVGDFRGFLTEGFHLHPDAPAVAREAIGAAVYALASDQIRHHGAEHAYEIAPTAIYLALAPFIGGAAAGRVANEPAPLAERAAA